ncbi:MAG: hypothetical protein VX945_04200 [Verrucomicrobiota bacterium]|nr:hypothetical protein [Verrucomicrobiota bacterium]
MKNCSILSLIPVGVFIFLFTVNAEIVIKPVRTPTVSTNRPGIIVPGPGGGITHEQQPQVIELLDGDALKGTFVGFDSETGVKWRHSAVKTDIEFLTDSLSRIQLFPRSQQLEPGQSTQIDLMTGEVLTGEVLELNDRHLILNAWYSRNSLRIPREKILSIRPSSEELGLIYEGPTGIDGWKTRGTTVGKVNNLNRAPQAIFGGRVPIPFPGKGINIPVPAGASGWKYAKKSFSATRSGSLIGRKLELGDSVNVEFDMAWQGSFNLGISLYADQLDAYSGSSYMVGISPNSCYLTRMANSVQNNLGQQTYQDLRGKSKARVSIRANKSESSMAVIINDRVIKQWEDNSGFAGKGENLMFVLLQNSLVKISNIRVSKWNGKLPSANSGEKKEGKDVLTTSNSTNLSGELLGIRDGKAIFKAGFSPVPLEITMDTITRMQLADTKPEKSKLGLGDVRVTFVEGGQFTFLLEKWGADRVSGLSTVLGRVDFRPGAFSVLEFNLTKKQSADGGDPFEDIE